MTRNSLLFHPLFIAGLLILLCNDFIFKPAFPGMLTGKLSDFAGLVVFPVFVYVIFPKSKNWIVVVTGVLFILWKTPLVTPLVVWINRYSPFTIQRIVDYSDYWALLVLPLAQSIINQSNSIVIQTRFLFKAGRAIIAVLSFFAICATSIRHPGEMPRGTVYIDKTFTVKKSRSEVIEAIRYMGYNVEYHEGENDSTAIGLGYAQSMSYYQTDSIVLFDSYSKTTDTILSVKYQLNEVKKNRTDIRIINVTLTKEGNI